MARRFAILVPLALLAALAIALLTRNGDRSPPDPPQIGKPVPAFDLPGLDAAHPGLSNADLRQGTVTLVNLFASWCLPCVAEAPQLKALADRGVVIHAIALRDEPANIQAFLKRHGDPFRRIALDPKGDMRRAFGASGLPETYLVDGDGIVRYRQIGDIRPEDVPDLIARIDAARRS